VLPEEEGVAPRPLGTAFGGPCSAALSREFAGRLAEATAPAAPVVPVAPMAPTAPAAPGAAGAAAAPSRCAMPGLGAGDGCAPPPLPWALTTLRSAVAVWLGVASGGGIGDPESAAPMAVAAAPSAASAIGLREEDGFVPLASAGTTSGHLGAKKAVVSTPVGAGPGGDKGTGVADGVAEPEGSAEVERGPERSCDEGGGASHASSN